MSESPFVSVVIPVLDNPRGLARCLAALHRQTYPRSCREVIVVDNGSHEPLDGILCRHPGVVCVRERAPGSYAARNKGVSLARGEVIAFTDSDCVPAPDWIRQGVSALRAAENCGLAAGRIELFVRDADRPTSVELYQLVTDFPQEQCVRKKRFGATANLFTRREVLARVGAFSGRLRSAGDRDWGNRVFDQGYDLVYADRAKVLHPARRTLAELRRKVSRITGGERDRADRLLISLVPQSLRYFRARCALMLELLRTRRLRGFGQRMSVLGVASLVPVFQAWEVIRLQTGAPSRR